MVQGRLSRAERLPVLPASIVGAGAVERAMATSGYRSGATYVHRSFAKVSIGDYTLMCQTEILVSHSGESALLATKVECTSPTTCAKGNR